MARGWAAEARLDTYHTERSPVARYNADRSRENTRNVGRIRKLVERGGADPVAEREAVAAAGRYGNWLGMDLGLRYEERCLVPDGTEPAAAADPVSDYRPEARPGQRAPHVPLHPGGGAVRLRRRQRGAPPPGGSRWTWARWPSRSKIMTSSAGPSTAWMAWGVMVANSAA